MANCHALTTKRPSANAARLLVPINCPEVSGIPNMIELEGMTDGSSSIDTAMVSVRDRDSGIFDSLLPSVTSGTMSVSGNFFKMEFAPGQKQMLENSLKQTRIAVQFMAIEATDSDKPGVSIFAQAYISNVTLDTTLDGGAPTYSFSIQLTDDIGFDASIIEI